ncbi:transmembrane protein 244-like isoform X2 [Pristis pectinata]|uniref:transmembrane protein 244-like isoform X2 n=1 Tax=Pristis pectinata TaxID=685728 RepID=UPI00223CB968|nr:transmembrane protein 244-like isoform X2 [Pristis pectinata]
MILGIIQIPLAFYMAFKGQVAGTKTVLLNLLECLLIFYILYYMIGSVCFGAFRLDSFDGLIPFDFKTQASKSSSKYLVNLLSMELTYFTSGLLFAVIVKEWVWDYSITVTLSHVMLSSAVAGLLMMICNGQLVAHFFCRNSPSYSSNNL